MDFGGTQGPAAAPHFLKPNPPFAPPEEFFGAAARQFFRAQCAARSLGAPNDDPFFTLLGAAQPPPPGPGLKQTQQRGKGADNHRRAGLSFFSRALKLHVVCVWGSPGSVRWYLGQLPAGPTVGHLADVPAPPPLVISRMSPPPHRWSSGGCPLEARDPRASDAVPRGRPGIFEEFFGRNGLESNSGRIAGSLSRNRRRNSAGWHRPGTAESGGFWVDSGACRNPPSP